MPLIPSAVVIVQTLDSSLLEALSESDADAADEDGYLDGNQHYQDMRTSTWSDVRYALVVERSLIVTIAQSSDPEAAERECCEQRSLVSEREGLWNLDVGVAAAVLALNALGGHTSLSCNGGAFGGGHASSVPSIRFFRGSASVDLLVRLAREARVGLVNEGGRGLLYGASVHDLQRFAAVALAQHDGEGHEA